MQAASNGGPLAALTQNKKAMIGIGVAAVLAIIILIVQMVSSMAPPPIAEAPPEGLSGAAPGEPGAMPGAPGEPGAAPMPGSADPALSAAMPGMPAPAGMPPAGAPPAGAAPAETGKKQPPGVPVRGNPFAPNKELAEVLKSIPEPPNAPEAMSPKHDLYTELYEPPASVTVSDDENEGPPVPPMRVTGIILGTQVSALMQIGGEFLQVTPGKWLPNENNPIYRVERIEQGKVILTRKWEEGNRKGIQRIEVGISGAAGGGTGPRPGGGFRPGMMPGMGGPTGSPTI